MVKILLNNQMPDSPSKTVIIDLSLGTCLINNNETINMNQLHELEFSHPLLSQAGLSKSKGLYCHSYDDLDGLLASAQCVYATLIKAKNPSNCHFNIKPSAHYFHLKKLYQLHLSLEHHKTAKEFIGTDQLNNIVTHLTHSKFQFHDSILINQTYSFTCLPELINGDDLYKTNSTIEQQLKQPADFEKYELRYINRLIGFGLYARASIKKDDVLF
ncbi:MAG: hypothetical protein ACHP65_10080, partial [Legionellales bacterium]